MARVKKERKARRKAKKRRRKEKRKGRKEREKEMRYGTVMLIKGLEFR